MKYMTAGELRGTSLVAIVDDVPAGLRLQAASIQADLDRWSHGCSCGERREVDCAAILSGVSADGRTTGSPLSLVVDNAAYRASLEDEAPGQAAVPRPGSADLAGLLATDADDCRSIVEGSSARSQAALIAASAVAREFLAEFGVEIQSYVTRIGAAAMREQPIDFETLRYTPLEIESSPFVAHRRKLLELWRKKSLRRAWRATRLAARSPWRYTASLPPWGRIAAAA